MEDSSEFLSARIKAVKHVMCVRPSVFYTYSFSDPIVWWELEKAGYPLRRNDKRASRKLEQDYNRLCHLNSTWELRLSNIFWHGIRTILDQPNNQRKNLTVSWCTVIRIGLGNQSPNVMASVRAREAFQTAAFPQFKLMKREQQNPKLHRLAELSLGDFEKGTAFKRTDAGIFKLLLVDDEPLDVEPLFATLVNLLEVHTGSLLVPGSHKDRFLQVMDSLDTGWKAFLGYTISAKETNAAAKEEFKAANPLPPKEEKPKKEYTPRKINLSKLERKFVEQGKAEIIDNKFVWTAEVDEPDTYNPASLLDVAPDINARMTEIFTERKIMTPDRVDLLTAGLEF